MLESATTAIAGKRGNDLPKFQIRFARTTDLKDCAGIDWLAFGSECVWREQDFRAAWKDNDAVFKVATIDGDVVAYVVWCRATKEPLYLCRIAVVPECRRFGIGSTLVWDWTRKLGGRSRRMIALTAVDESNLATQLFLRKCGWIADTVIDGKIAFVFRAEWNDGC